MVETAKELIKRVTSNRERCATLTAEAAEIVEVAKQKELSLKNLYGDRILNEEIARDKAISELKAKRKFDYRQKLEQVGVINQELDGLKRILTIIRLPRTDLPRGQSLEIGGIDVVGGGIAFSEGYVINSEFLKVKLFIVPSSKASQEGETMWALVAIGKCYFPEFLLKLPPKTRVPFPTQGQYQVECVIHEAVGPAELRAWLESNRETLRAQLLGVYAAVEAEYLGVLRNFKPEEFNELITSVCKNCGYFTTSLDDVTPGGQCPRCLKAMTAWPEPVLAWPNR